MPAEFVDCVLTSPPYWGLRSYKTEPVIWGEDHCEHQWGKGLPGHHPGQVEQTKWKDAEAAGAGQTAKSGNFCLKCHAWKGELGLEPTIELYISHLLQIFDEVKRVLKATGTVWINLGDSYSGGEGQSGCGDADYQAARTDPTLNKPYHQMGGHGVTRPADGDIGIPPKSLCLIPERFALGMVERGWILRNVIIWYKCLAGTMPIYFRSNGKCIRSSVREMARLPISGLELPTTDGWAKVTNLSLIGERQTLTLHLRNGSAWEVTPEHRFCLKGELWSASMLRPGMALDSYTLPDSKGTQLGTYDNGWVVGFYLAEGSPDGKGLQFSMHAKEEEYTDRLRHFTEAYGGEFAAYVSENKRVCKVSGAAPAGVILHYAEDKGAKKKHCSGHVWQENNDFLRGLIEGYLAGDGHWDKYNRRWRLGFAWNPELLYDLKTICTRLGWYMRGKPARASCNGKTYAIVKGQIRDHKSGHHNDKSDWEIIRISQTAAPVYEIGIDSRDHFFILPDGVLTHNSNPMPESVKDRFTGTYEYVYFFTKSRKYWFEQQFEAQSPLTLKIGSHYKLGGSYHNAQKRGELNEGYEFKGNGKNFRKFDIGGRNKRDVWEINTQPYPEAHFATFPEDLCKTPILSGCPSMICKKCGKAREPIYEQRETFDCGRIGEDRDIGQQQRKSLPSKMRDPNGAGWASQSGQKLGYSDCGCGAGFEPGIVLDPFCGSGTALAVAKSLGRKSIGIEINPKYCALAVKRIQRIPIPMEF